MNPGVLTVLSFVLSILFVNEAAYGQAVADPVNKTQALKNVKVSAIPGWKEVVSDQGRFRAIFPRAPEIGDQGTGDSAMRGLKVIDARVHWFVLYADLDRLIIDEFQIRERYQQSLKGLVNRGARVVKQTDVTLNGRLGLELILQDKSRVSFMRVFVVDRRVYTLDVDQKRSDLPEKIPADVQEFFDSFTFWQ